MDQLIVGGGALVVGLGCLAVSVVLIDLVAGTRALLRRALRRRDLPVGCGCERAAGRRP
jgi:hypothetical protein